jgi:hypothetical protein
MGRTLETANQIILKEQREFADFRRTLRQNDQRAFDELFANARKHTAAITMAAHALPFEAVLLAMLLEEHVENQRLEQKVEALEALIERLLSE